MKAMEKDALLYINGHWDLRHDCQDLNLPSGRDQLTKQGRRSITNYGAASPNNLLRETIIIIKLQLAFVYLKFSSHDRKFLHTARKNIHFTWAKICSNYCKLVKVWTLCILCNNWSLFVPREMMPSLAWCPFKHSIGQVSSPE